MLGRTELAVNRRGMLGLKIAARLRSTMAFDRDQAEGLGNRRFGRDRTIVSRLEHTAQHMGGRCQRPIVLSRLIFPARPNS
jgi:hypothetical protein